MEFEIKIKPLVLFDLEDKINIREQQSKGSGKQFYEHFLSELSELTQRHSYSETLYQSVKEYKSEKIPCKLYYMISGQTIYLMGLR